MPDMPPKPYWHPIWLRCGRCHHDWDDWQPAMCPIPTWVAHVKTFSCPKCSASDDPRLYQARPKILLRMTPIEREPVKSEVTDG